MIKDKTYYELRYAMLMSRGESKNQRLLNKVKRKLRAFDN